jgi:hypothetical protein
MRYAYFWDRKQRWVVVLYRRFGTMYRFHLQVSRNLLDHWRWDRQVVPKRRHTTTTQRCVIYQKNAKLKSEFPTQQCCWKFRRFEREALSFFEWFRTLQRHVVPSKLRKPLTKRHGWIISEYFPAQRYLHISPVYLTWNLLSASAQPELCLILKIMLQNHVSIAKHCLHLHLYTYKYRQRFSPTKCTCYKNTKIF